MRYICSGGWELKGYTHEVDIGTTNHQLKFLALAVYVRVRTHVVKIAIDSSRLLYVHVYNLQLRLDPEKGFR